MNRVIWAVDVFEEQTVMEARDTVTQLQERFGAEVEPVYVLAPSEEGEPYWTPGYREAAEQALAEVMRATGLKGLEKPKVVALDSNAGNRRRVLALEDYAHSVKADMILVGTTRKRTITRLLIGSFSEGMLKNARRPVMLQRPPELAPVDAPRPVRPLCVLPTDFGPGSRLEVQDAVRFCRRLKGDLLLYHLAPGVVEPFVQSGAYLLGGGWVPMFPLITHDLHARKRRAEAWARWARRRGVQASAVVDELPGSLPSAIVECARSRGASWLLMPMRDHHLGSWGSVVKEVVRHASCPVWAFRGGCTESWSGSRGKGTVRVA